MQTHVQPIAGHKINICPESDRRDPGIWSRFQFAACCRAKRHRRNPRGGGDDDDFVLWNVVRQQETELRKELSIGSFFLFSTCEHIYSRECIHPHYNYGTEPCTCMHFGVVCARVRQIFVNTFAVKANTTDVGCQQTCAGVFDIRYSSADSGN